MTLFSFVSCWASRKVPHLNVVRGCQLYFRNSESSRKQLALVGTVRSLVPLELRGQQREHGWARDWEDQSF